jgi:hypothetical protein
VAALGEKHDFELQRVEDFFHLLLLLTDTVCEPFRVSFVLAETALENRPHFVVIELLDAFETLSVGCHCTLNNFSDSWIHLN